MNRATDDLRMVFAMVAQQAFPILPSAEDPDAGNVYRDLKFPDDVYQHIEEYHEKKAEAEHAVPRPPTG